jgi:hypothetical protein
MLGKSDGPGWFPYKGVSAAIAAVFVVFFVLTAVAVMWSGGENPFSIAYAVIALAGSFYVVWTTLHLAAELVLTNDSFAVRKGKQLVSIPWDDIGAFRAVVIYGAGETFFRLKPKDPQRPLPVSRFYVNIGSLAPRQFERLNELIAGIERHVPRERSWLELTQ